jgi:ribosomal-protein-alanine N-acetyltransferase
MLNISFNPFPIIETERLLLKKFEITDAQDQFLLRSNEQCMKYIGKPTHKSIDESIELINLKHTNIVEGSGIDWAIFYKTEQKIIGSIAIHKIDKQNHRGEIGYMLQPAYWNQGIISEALHEIIKYAFNTLNLHSLEALLDINNEASIAVLTKFKFIKEAHFKENYFFNDEFIDTLVFSLLKSNHYQKK